MSDNPALDHPALASEIAATVRDLAVEERPRPVTATVARTVIARVAWHAYQRGRADAIGELRTANDVAAELGIIREMVLRAAKRDGLGWHTGRDWLFTADDVERLRNRKQRPGPAKRAG